MKRAVYICALNRSMICTAFFAVCGRAPIFVICVIY